MIPRPFRTFWRVVKISFGSTFCTNFYFWMTWKITYVSALKFGMLIIESFDYIDKRVHKKFEKSNIFKIITVKRFKIQQFFHRLILEDQHQLNSRGKSTWKSKKHIEIKYYSNLREPDISKLIKDNWNSRGKEERDSFWANFREWECTTMHEEWKKLA